MAIQSGCVAPHWIWFTSPSAAVYASIGSSIALGICWMSQMSAWWSSPAVQMWQELKRALCLKENIFQASVCSIVIPVRCPSDSVDTGPVIAKPSDRCARYPNVQNDNFARIHCYGGQVVWILFIPSETKQRYVGRILVNDGRVFQMT